MADVGFQSAVANIDAIAGGKDRDSIGLQSCDLVRRSSELVRMEST